MDLRIYHLYKDPAPGVRYQPILGATVVIDGRIRLAGLSIQALQRALNETALIHERPKGGGV